MSVCVAALLPLTQIACVYILSTQQVKVRFSLRYDSAVVWPAHGWLQRLFCASPFPRILLIPAWYPWSAVMNSPALPALLWLNLHENISETWDCCTGFLSFPKPKLQLLPGEHQITSKENFYSSGLFQFPWSRCFVCDWNMPPPIRTS